MRRTVNFWKGLAPLLLRFCKVSRTPFNEVVNHAVEDFLGVASVPELRLLARCEVLMREESELRRVCSVMLRSGSYLPDYVQKVLREPGRHLGHLMDAQRPLKALNPAEERVFRRIATRREKIAQELAAIQDELLKDVKPFRLKPTDSWSRRRDKVHTPVNNVRETKGENENGKIA